MQNLNWDLGDEILAPGSLDFDFDSYMDQENLNQHLTPQVWPSWNLTTVFRIASPWAPATSRFRFHHHFFLALKFLDPRPILSSYPAINGFNSLLPLRSDGNDFSRPEPILTVPERSSVLNTILHIIYHMSCTQYSPSFDILVEAVSTLKTYGISAKNVITSSTPVHSILLSHAADRALELFALASQNDLHDLAVSSSSFLLSISLSAITDQMAEQIGPIYLKRLFFMHLGRAEVLKNILLPPPYPHPPTSTCDTMQQKSLTRAWVLASASLVWDARADVSINAMKAVLSPLGDFLPCELCRTALNERIQTLISRWLAIKRTI